MKFSIIKTSLIRAILIIGFTITARYFIINNYLEKSASNRKKSKRNQMSQGRELFDLIRNYSTEKHIEIYFKDEEECIEKFQILLESGYESLHVISDFDRTLSRNTLSCGMPNPTCHGLFETDPELPEYIRQEYNDLRDVYMGIEFDPNMTNEEKLPHMIDWWTKGHKLIVSSGLHRDVLQKSISKAILELRDDVDKFMEKLSNFNVPMLLFSAGIGDVIKEVLITKQLLLSNVKIVSNFMEFDEAGVIKGFSDPLIHTFNKTAHAIDHTDYWNEVCTVKTNVLLLGDSSGDHQMSHGLDDSFNVIKIGFINNNVEKLKDQYTELYDIVLVIDESFRVPQIILNQLFISSS